MSAGVMVTLQRTDEDTATAVVGNVYEASDATRSTIRVAPATTVPTAIGRHDHITWHRPDNQGGTP